MQAESSQWALLVDAEERLFGRPQVVRGWVDLVAKVESYKTEWRSVPDPRSSADTPARKVKGPVVNNWCRAAAYVL
jgi:hypothetical protein